MKFVCFGPFKGQKIEFVSWVSGLTAGWTAACVGNYTCHSCLFLVQSNSKTSGAGICMKEVLAVLDQQIDHRWGGKFLDKAFKGLLTSLQHSPRDSLGFRYLPALGEDLQPFPVKWLARGERGESFNYLWIFLLEPPVVTGKSEEWLFFQGSCQHLKASIFSGSVLEREQRFWETLHFSGESLSPYSFRRWRIWMSLVSCSLSVLENTIKLSDGFVSEWDP